MKNTEAILAQTVEQLETMNEALAGLRRELLPGQPRKFAILAEGPLEEIRRLQQETIFNLQSAVKRSLAALARR
jgi:hypothetical protein